MFNLKGRVAVITGASSGLGKQMASALAEQGADLVIIARRIERLEEFKVELEKKDVRVLPIKCDVTKTEDIEAAAALTEKEFGKVDILFNVAGVSKDKGVLDMSDVAYHSSKGGVVDFTRSVAAELAKYNIICNAICPGYFETELTKREEKFLNE